MERDETAGQPIAKGEDAEAITPQPVASKEESPICRDEDQGLSDGRSSTGPPPTVYSAVYLPPPMEIPKESFETTCPHCHGEIMTRTEWSKGLLQWILCGGLCLVGCWCGCCLFPFAVESLYDVEHFCPRCNALIGRRKGGGL